MKQQFIRIFSLFLAFLILLGFGPVPARAADSISLPSPSAYFGSNPKTEMDGKVTVYIYSFSSYPEAKVDQYVKDMQAKGLTLTKKENWKDGDALRRMEWKKDSAVILWWRAKTKTIEVRVHPCVTLTSGTAAVSTENTQIPLPMPKDYFKNAKENFYEAEYKVYRYTYKYHSFPTKEVEKYKAALEQLGFDTHYQQNYSSGNILCSIKMNDTQCISIYFNKEEKKFLVNLFDEKLAEAGYISSGSTYAPVKAAATGATTVSVPTETDGYLPDPTSFLGVLMYDDRESGKGSCWQYSVTFNSDDAGKQALKEYLEVLKSPEYKLELIDYQVIDYTLIGRGYTHQLSFRYTGEKDIAAFKDYNNQMSHVCLVVNHTKDAWGLTPSLYVSIDYKDKLIDSGKRASVRVIDRLTGGNSYDITDDDDDKHTVPCGTCNKSGDCQNCGGDGYVYSSASKKEDRNCPSCHGRRGKCGSCGGDGWLN